MFHKELYWDLSCLCYINDIDENISSTIRLLADDCVIYRIIDFVEDTLCLQRDLHTIYSWANKWQMKLNIDKCVVLRCTRSLSPLQFVYKVNDKTLKVNEQHQYFGIIFHEHM